MGRKKEPGQIKVKKCLICKERFTYRVKGGDRSPKTCGKWDCEQTRIFGG